MGGRDWEPGEEHLGHTATGLFRTGVPMLNFVVAKSRTRRSDSTTADCISLPQCLSGKESSSNVRDIDLIHGSGRPPREGNGISLQYSCLGDPMDRGARQATVHGITKELDMTKQLNNNWLCQPSHCHPKTSVNLLDGTDCCICCGFEKSKGKRLVLVERRDQKCVKQHVQCDSVLVQKYISPKYQH